MKRNFGFVGLFLIMALVPVSAFSAGLDSASFTPPELIEPSGGGVPVGTIIAWPVAANPKDAAKWLECNGQAVSQAAYPKLYAVIGARVPDYRGLFLRGYGSQRHSKNNGSTVGVTNTTHTSGALRQIQGDSIREIYGGFSELIRSGRSEATDGAIYYGQGHASGVHPGDSGGWEKRAGNMRASRVVPTANEVRPVNMAVRYLIRAAD